MMNIVNTRDLSIFWKKTWMNLFGNYLFFRSLRNVCSFPERETFNCREFSTIHYWWQVQSICSGVTTMCGWELSFQTTTTSVKQNVEIDIVKKKYLVDCAQDSWHRNRKFVKEETLVASTRQAACHTQRCKDVPVGDLVENCAINVNCAINAAVLAQTMPVGAQPCQRRSRSEPSLFRSRGRNDVATIDFLNRGVWVSHSVSNEPSEEWK